MQADVMIGKDIVGRAHDVVRVNKFSVSRLLLKNTHLDSAPWKRPLGITLNGKVIQVRFTSWKNCNQEGDHLVFRDVSLDVLD